jgi:hypothetical protein
MSARALMAGIAALFLATGTAHVEPLPNIFLGRWCQFMVDSLYRTIETQEEWETCLDGNAYMEITHDGWTRPEEDCKFISIEDTGEKSPTNTQPREDDWVPVMLITANCYAEGNVREIQIIFYYGKGGFLSLNGVPLY